jgi:hypothetical protein
LTTHACCVFAELAEVIEINAEFNQIVDSLVQAGASTVR